ncbi:MAG: fibronectin type III-like domain-contianing protein [Verrucomicrobia bacterium]|nr:fibronectin type III-like domain-contianing protein [Verrucomicrobiota bacterium]
MILSFPVLAFLQVAERRFGAFRISWFLGFPKVRRSLRTTSTIAEKTKRMKILLKMRDSPLLHCEERGGRTVLVYIVGPRGVKLVVAMGQLVEHGLGSFTLALRPGQKKTVAFTLAGEKLAFWDVKTHSFRVEPGAFEVLVGSSSEYIRVQSRIEVN